MESGKQSCTFNYWVCIPLMSQTCMLAFFAKLLNDSSLLRTSDVTRNNVLDKRGKNLVLKRKHIIQLLQISSCYSYKFRKHGVKEIVFFFLKSEQLESALCIILKMNA